MQKWIATATLATLALAPFAASAQMMGHDHAKMSATASPSTPPAQAAKTAEGEVRKVDAAKGTVVLKHGPLDALGMPPMTMEFKATDPKILALLKPGDKVKFVPAQGKSGELLVSSIEIVKG